MNNRNNQHGGHGQCQSCSSSTQKNLPAGSGKRQQLNQPIPVNTPKYNSNGCCTLPSVCSSSSESTYAPSQSSKTGIDKDAAGFVREIDEKFNKFRKKIQKDTTGRSPKKCYNIKELLSKPPWSAPEPQIKKPLKERNCRPVQEKGPEDQPISGNDCCQETVTQQVHAESVPSNQECNPNVYPTVNAAEQNNPNAAQQQQNQVLGHEKGYCGCTDGEMASGHKGYQAYEPSTPQVVEPPIPPKSQKIKNPCKVKKFSEPANLRKKLNQYFENKPDDKNNPMGSFVPFYDGTIDLSSCLSRGAEEGLETWELGHLVCEHPKNRADCSNCGFPPTDYNSQPQVQSRSVANKEVKCLNKIMPPNLTCQQQIDFIQCMGATDEVIRKFQKAQECSNTNKAKGSNLTTLKETSTCKICEAGEMQRSDQKNQRKVGENNESKAESDGNEEIDYQDLNMFGPPPIIRKRTMAETFKLYKDHLSNIRRRYFGEVVKHIDEVDDITPETAAAMVFTEEHRMPMRTAPAKIYEYLYPEHPSQPLLKIGDVTNPDFLPENVNNIVVPLVPPMMLETEQFPGLEDPAMLDSPRVIQVGPSMNLADEPEISVGTKPADIVEVVMGQADIFYPQEDEDEEDERLGESTDFDVKLHQAMPPHYSRFQLRGSQAPNWFPGYYVAMPSKNGVTVQEKIGNVLELAWEETQPETIKPRDGAVIIGY